MPSTSSPPPATTFTVTYSGNGSTGEAVPSDGTSYASGATVTVLGNSGILVIGGSSFIGWNTTAAGTGTHYDPGATLAITANVTLYAQWTTAQVYTVTFDANSAVSGTAPTTNNYLAGATVTTPSAGTLVHPVNTFFGGWNTAADGTGIGYNPGATFTLGAMNVTLYSWWGTASQAIAAWNSVENGIEIAMLTIPVGTFLYTGSGATAGISAIGTLTSSTTDITFTFSSYTNGYLDMC